MSGLNKPTIRCREYQGFGPSSIYDPFSGVIFDEGADAEVEFNVHQFLLKETISQLVKVRP